MALGLKPIEIIEKGKQQLLGKAAWWERVYLGDIAEVKNGFAFKSRFFTHNIGMPLIRIRDISRELTENLYSGPYEDGFLVSRGDILIGMDGDFNCSRWKGKSGLLNQRVCKIDLRSGVYNDTFLFLCLQPYLNAINEETSSVTVKHLSSITIQEIPLPLPSLEEQHRIVAKIEELFSELDKGIESLKTAREQLKVYRQSLLKHAFEGKLTEQWRKDNADKLETADELLARIQQERIGYLAKKVEGGDKEARRYLEKTKKGQSVRPSLDLPEFARWVNLLDVCFFIVDCHNKTAPYQSEGIYLIRTPCIRGGKILLNDESRFISEETYAYWSRRCSPEPGDVIFTREAPMGEAGIVPEGVKLCMGQRMMLMRPPKQISSEYLLYCFMEPQFQARFEVDSVGTGVKHLRVGDVEKLSIPLYPEDEQQEIVNILDSQLSVVDELQQEIADNLSRTEALRQSILKKAFSGKLVPQDPNDEPASALLKRIAAEKAELEAAANATKTAVKVAKKVGSKTAS